MKNTNIVFYILSALILFGVLGFSCKSTKSTASENQALLVTLDSEQSGKYIMNQYSEYAPTECIKSNKTINQYIATFACSPKKFITLKENLANDPIVIELQETNSSNDEIISGKNDKRAKTKSIRDKN